jgi:hypothetical protein
MALRSDNIVIHAAHRSNQWGGKPSDALWNIQCNARLQITPAYDRIESPLETLISP